MIGSVGGSLPSRGFVIRDGVVYDADQYWRDHADSLAQFGKPQEMEEIFIPNPKPEDWTPVRVDLSDQVKDLHRMELSADEYESFLTRLEDWTLENFTKTQLKPDVPDEIRISSTSVFDLVMGDKKDSIGVEDWYAQQQTMSYEMKRAQIATNRMNRGKEVDPDDLLVQVGDLKLTLDQIATIQRGLLVADSASKASNKAASSIFSQVGAGGRETSNWSASTWTPFALLSVKKALTRSDVPQALADKIFQRSLENAAQANERNYSIQCQIDAMMGRSNAGFMDKYDRNPGTHSLSDTNCFVTDIWNKMLEIDVSTDASFRQGFGKFADWYTAEIEQVFSTYMPASVAKQSAGEYKQALFNLKSIYGL